VPLCAFAARGGELPRGRTNPPQRSLAMADAAPETTDRALRQPAVAI